MRDRIRVLLVDDDDLLRSTVKSVLTLSGYEVRAAPTAEFALEILEEVDPDMILTDNTMPGMSGAEMLKKLPPKYLARTTIWSGATLDAAFLPVPVRYKPLSKEELLEVVESGVARGKLFGKRILIEQGGVFDGNAWQFEDAFFSWPTEESVRSFCSKEGWAVEFLPEEDQAC